MMEYDDLSSHSCEICGAMAVPLAYFDGLIICMACYWFQFSQEFRDAIDAQIEAYLKANNETATQSKPAPRQLPKRDEGGDMDDEIPF